MADEFEAAQIAVGIWIKDGKLQLRLTPTTESDAAILKLCEYDSSVPVCEPDGALLIEFNFSRRQ
jgi:hypothetical protein